MKVKPRGARRQSERPFVADEMHFVAAPRQVFPQGRGEDAAAADGRIAGDADFEEIARAHVKTRVRLDSVVPTNSRPGNHLDTGRWHDQYPRASLGAGRESI